ncbi:MAG: DUF1836 domain-containing protein [Emergencia sp.]
MARTKGLEQFKLPRWEELPSIDLYLDQVLSLLEEWLGPYLTFDGKKVMTKTMINNYVKQKFIAAPVNKKYDRTAVASLFVIAILKPVYTIEEIARLIRLAVRTSCPENSYNQFCQTVEQAVEHAFKGTSMKKEFSEGDPRWILWNVCNSFACQLYVRNIYLQSHQKDDKL